MLREDRASMHTVLHSTRSSTVHDPSPDARGCERVHAARARTHAERIHYCIQYISATGRRQTARLRATDSRELHALRVPLCALLVSLYRHGRPGLRVCDSIYGYRTVSASIRPEVIQVEQCIAPDCSGVKNVRWSRGESVEEQRRVFTWNCT